MVKLGDFGLSKLLQSSNDCASSMVGTMNYVAPEVVKGNPYNHKADAYSLGCVLNDLLLVTADGNDKIGPMGIVHALKHSDPSKRLSVEEVACNTWMKAW
jgi:serine/threonine protein kinase